MGLSWIVGGKRFGLYDRFYNLISKIGTGHIRQISIGSAVKTLPDFVGSSCLE
jgi:hypothetical protein